MRSCSTAALAAWKSSREQYLLANVPGGGFVAGTPYSLTAFAEEGVAPNPITDAVAVTFWASPWSTPALSFSMRPTLSSMTAGMLFR